MVKNPFSLYDFLGYLIPGIFFLYIAFAFINIPDNQTIDNPNFKYYFDYFIFPSLEFSWTSGIIVLIISYIIGLFLAFISSITIEIFTNIIYDYPSKYLLSPPNEKLGFNCKVLVDLYKEKNSFKRGEIKDINWNKYKSLKRLDIFGLLSLFLLPITICEFLFGKMLKINTLYAKRLDLELQNTILNEWHDFKEKNKFKININNDYHRIIYHYIYEKMGRHAVKTDNYVALYGIMRSLSLIMVLLFWWLILSTMPFLGIKYPEIKGSIVIPIIITGFIAYIFYMGFIKFYRRFTLESLMSLVVDKCQE